MLSRLVNAPMSCVARNEWSSLACNAVLLLREADQEIVDTGVRQSPRKNGESPKNRIHRSTTVA